jgi:hypothetical protein
MRRLAISLARGASRLLTRLMMSMIVLGLLSTFASRSQHVSLYPEVSRTSHHAMLVRR